MKKNETKKVSESIFFSEVETKKKKKKENHPAALINTNKAAVLL